ncbi:P-loop ATPase, Sll1717 family [Streptomyces sp. NPDC021098]|uniref:P-loop ATPase, Sll1717 family n=1 Tax=unclassified Streptomyces TaxID=2593676 RepID=UPI003796A4B0
MADESALAHLHFGREDAERDVTDGLLLRGGFLRTTASDAAVSGRKTLIIGRKGSGKSAICMHLMSDGVHPGGKVLITPDDAAGDEIRRFELQGLPADSAKALIWRYVFAIHAARHLLSHAKDAHGRKHRSLKALHRFLKQNDELPGDRLGNRLARGARGLQTALSLEAFGFKAGLELASSPSEGARATRQLEVLEEGVARAFTALGCTSTHSPLLILVDQLERVWSAEPDSNSMVIGLLLAAKHTMGLYGQAVRCLLFLRSDIYDSLSFGEGDKFHGDELRIAWTDQALRDLALARARATAGAGLTEERLWREIFPRTVRGEGTPDYLFGRCLPRPRDVIQFLNLCQETAWLTYGRNRITEADIHQASLQFSAWKLKDLVLEYLVAHPFLERLFPLFQNTGYAVARAALGGRFEEAAETLHRLFPAYAEALTLSGVIDVLYGVGFLGVRRGSDVVFAGGGELPVQPHETEFHVHPCFRAALGATSAIDLHRFAPGVAGARIASGNIGHFAPRASLVSHDYRLLGELRRSCHSILAQVGRAVDLSQDARDEITQRISRVLDHLGDPPGDDILLQDPEHHLLGAAHYFITLAAQLNASGLDTARSGGVAHRIEDEARRLRQLAGGSFGSSGNSAGYGY